MKPRAPRSTDAFSLGVLILALAPGVCAGQMNGNSAAYNAGYGRTAGSENQPIDVSTTDASGNLTVVGGLVKSSAAGSVFAQASGVGSASSGVSTGSGASAIGNSLNVVVQGNDNVVVVNSTQTNTGAVTATTEINGK